MSSSPLSSPHPLRACPPPARLPQPASPPSGSSRRTRPSGSSLESPPVTPGLPVFGDMMLSTSQSLPTWDEEERTLMQQTLHGMMRRPRREAAVKDFYQCFFRRLFKLRPSTLSLYPVLEVSAELNFSEINVLHGPSWQRFQQPSRVMAQDLRRRSPTGASMRTIETSEGFWTKRVPGNWGVRTPDFAVVASCEASAHPQDEDEVWASISLAGDFKPAQVRLQELCCQVTMYCMTMHHATGGFLGLAIRQTQFSRLFVVDENLIAIESILSHNDQPRIVDIDVFATKDFGLRWHADDGQLGISEPAADALAHHLTAARQVFVPRPSNRPLRRLRARTGPHAAELRRLRDESLPVNAGSEAQLHIAHLLRRRPASSDSGIGSKRKGRSEPSDVGASRKRPRHDAPKQRSAGHSRAKGQGDAREDTSDDASSATGSNEEDPADTDGSGGSEIDSEDDKFAALIHPPADTSRSMRMCRLVEWLEDRWNQHPPRPQREFRKEQEAFVDTFEEEPGVDALRKPMIPMQDILRDLHVTSPGLRVALVSSSLMTMLVKETLPARVPATDFAEQQATELTADQASKHVGATASEDQRDIGMIQ